MAGNDSIYYHSLSLYYLENHHGGTVEHIIDVNGLSHCFPTVQCQDRR